MFDISSAERASEDALRAIERRRDRVPLPRAISIVDDYAQPASIDAYRTATTTGPTRFTIVRRGTVRLPLVLFCVAWDAVLVPFLLIPGWNKIFILPFVVVGAYLTYLTLCRAVNRTFIRADGGILRITHAPLPWPKMEVDASELSQIFCEERVAMSSEDKPVVMEYDVAAHRKDGRKVYLLKGLATPDQALFVEQSLEERLGIVDVAVAGELPR